MRISRFNLKGKKILLPLITCVLTLASFVTGFIAVKKMPYPIPITSEKEFYLFTEKYRDGYFVLKNSITFTEPIKPIGDKNHPFKGMIDGGSYNLNKVTIDLSLFNDSYYTDNRLYVGLFPFNEGVIMNINISGMSFINSNNVDVEKYSEIICGGICGRNDGRVSNSSLLITNIDLDCNFDSFTFGSIVGENRCELHKCKMLQNIAFKGQADTLICGGILGTNNNGLVDRCYRKGWIGVHNYSGTNLIAGGICGSSHASTFTDCALYDNFYGNNAGFNFYDYNVKERCYIGGIAGNNQNGETGTSITNSYCNPTFSIRDNPHLVIGLCYGNTDRMFCVSNTIVSTRANIGESDDLGLFDVGPSASTDYIDNTFALTPFSSNKNFVELLDKRTIDNLTTEKLKWDDSFWSITDRIECKL